MLIYTDQVLISILHQIGVMLHLLSVPPTPRDLEYGNKLATTNLTIHLQEVAV